MVPFLPSLEALVRPQLGITSAHNMHHEPLEFQGADELTGKPNSMTHRPFLMPHFQPH
ncbi:hypothetical protein I79_009026 [Cricetulus griseus]|uniref:Uncharacterized protein n=1 Tax=Cricetulus griseus TaxID=10029 RepID=G3HEN8_CRIGR|nr:hypothetical protein I79_009026 [Cricetulus griseus]